MIEGADGLKSVSLGLFHALGRLLYCKRIPPDADSGSGLGPPAKRKKLTRSASSGPLPEQLPHELLVPKAQRPPLYYVPEEVMEKSNTDPQIFLAWIFTNAPRFYGDLDDLANFATAFAECDAWAGGSRPSHEVESLALNDFAASVQIRSLLDANLHPIQPIRDPWSDRSSEESPASTFNMVRPLLWDVQRHRTRRLEELRGHLDRLGPEAFGSLSLSQSLVTTTLPYVHQLLSESRGQHLELQQLPHPLMQLIMELSAGVDGEVLRKTAQRKAARDAIDVPAEVPKGWNRALPEDPIED